MSNSQKLSQTISSYPIKNYHSSSQERMVKIAMNRIYKILKIIYPYIKFKREKKLFKKDINKKLAKANPNSKTKMFCDKSFISPDSGFIYAFLQKEWKLILVIEAKKQGTNKIRESMGYAIQSKGNAIERASKNYCEITNFQIHEKIFPYIIFVSGCDFSKNSSIYERLTGLNANFPINIPYVLKQEQKIGKKINLASVTSLFIREKQWSIKEIYEIGLKAAEIAIAHYLKKK